MRYEINTPLANDKIEFLKAGDIVNITGEIYTARDSAHKRMVEMIIRGEELPFCMDGQVIYYVGPCPAREGTIIGSCGPTTSSRMDKYAPYLIELGLKGMIGKGLRNENVINAMVKYKAVYFGAIGGAAALIAKSIIKQEIVAFEDLGTEAIRKLTVKDFPATVIIDCEGNNLYEIGKNKYKR